MMDLYYIKNRWKKIRKLFLFSYLPNFISAGSKIIENKSNQLVLRQTKTKMYLIASQQVKISIYIIFPFLPKAFFYQIALTVVNSLSSSGNWFFRAKVMCPSRSCQVPLRYFVRFFSGASAFFSKMGFH